MESNFILEFLKGFHLQTIVSLAIIMWYLTRDIKKDIKDLDKDVRIMNMRVARLEGTVYGKDLYNFRDEKEDK